MCVSSIFPEKIIEIECGREHSHKKFVKTPFLPKDGRE
jgi:hypothetical protein